MLKTVLVLSGSVSAPDVYGSALRPPVLSLIILSVLSVEPVSIQFVITKENDHEKSN
jgi:hypothetical protein